MAKRKRKQSAELTRLKKNLSQRIYRYNKSLTQKGIPDDLKFKGTVKGLTTKKQVNRLSKQLDKAKKDKITQNKKGLWLRESDIKRINKAIKEANKKLDKAQKANAKKRKEIAKKWGREEPPIKVLNRPEEKIRYKRNADDFSTYKALRDFESRLNNVSPRGLNGEDLKEAIIKAIRGEVYQQANGFKFAGGANNVLARFIEEQLTADEVEFFFGGKLNFEYIYGMQDGLIKEMEIVNQIINNPEYPRLGEIWREDYEEEWHDFMQYRLEELDPDYVEAYSDHLEKLSEYLDNL